MILLAMHSEDTFVFYIPGVACHGIASLCALACLVSKGRESESLCRRVYYYTFTIVCTFGLQSYSLVVLRQYPQFGVEFCYSDETCIEAYESAKLGLWVVAAICNIYFAYTLMRFSEQDPNELAEMKLDSRYY